MKGWKYLEEVVVEFLTIKQILKCVRGYLGNGGEVFWCPFFMKGDIQTHLMMSSGTFSWSC